MAATLFLYLPPLPNTTPHFPYSKCNPNSESFTLLSLSFTKYHKPIYSSTCSNPSNDFNKKENITKSTNHNSSFSEEPFSRTGSTIKVPTAPWMKGPLILEPSQVLDFSRPRTRKNSPEKSQQSLTDKISGGRGKKAMKKVFQGIEKLQQHQNLMETQKEISPEQFEFDFPLEELRDDKFGGRMPWERDERMIFRRTKKEKVVSAAELSLDGVLLERLRGEAAKMRKWVKVNKAGVTEAVVDQIFFIWKNDDLAMLKFDMPLCRNMERACEIVEFKTGGLVVWSKKDELVVYRGCNYKVGLKSFSKRWPSVGDGKKFSFSNINYPDNISVSQVKSNERTVEEMISRKDGEESIIPISGSLYEREGSRLLEGLGPLFVDWWRPKPLPVDGDLLPEVVPGFQPPFRLCPPNGRSKLTDDELTYFRKLARPLPTHFVLGRNRKLQGLAAAILKLWEKCHIAKIAVKWGIPNTDNDQMANELKCLTGGVLLLRNKFFIILYRGKDFLPCGVADLVEERETELQRCQLQEEAARLKAIETFYLTDEPLVNTSTTGTLSEFQDIRSECGDLEKGNKEVEVRLEAETERLKKEIRKQERKLFILRMKIERTSKELAKLNSAWRPSERDADQELITHEERECFRKIGLKMDSSLVLGRRGVFDGVIEGLHQHWKHREIVKVITMQRVFSRIIYTAKLIEAESGGILISVDKLKEGHAIIIYRGKNYRRPLKLMPQNLLSKREALHRSLEMQRIGSLKFFAYQREQTIYNLKCKLAELQKKNGLIEENPSSF